MFDSRSMNDVGDDDQSASIQCLWTDEHGNVITISIRLPNADINEVGVVFAYLIGAYISWTITTAFYVCGLIPSDLLNDFDTRLLRIKLRSSARWVTGLRKSFFAFNIQQLVLGIAILGAGFANFSDAVLFDFNTVIYMAWMSLTAYFFTVMLLYPCFLSSQLYRALAFCSMSTLFIMLCVALYPTISWDWAAHVVTRAGCGPTECPILQTSVNTAWHTAKRQIKQSSISIHGVMAYLIILINYISQAMSLLLRKRQIFRNVCRKLLIWIGHASHRLSGHTPNGKRSLWMRCRIFMLIGLYILLFAILELISSFAFKMWMLAMALSWGSMQLLMSRYLGLPACVRPALNEWTFGQILPMILVLLTPFYGVFEYLSCNNSEATPGSQTGRVEVQEAVRHPISVSFKMMKDGDAEAAQTILHGTLYTSAYFTMILALLGIINFGSAAGFVIKTAAAYTSTSRRTTWWTIHWGLWPDVIGTASGIGCVYILAALSPLFSKKLYI